MSNTVSPLPFWTPLHFGNHDLASPVERFSEVYFELGGIIAEIVHLHDSHIEVALNKLNPPPFILTCAKVVLIATMLLPLTVFLLVVKWILRARTVFVIQNQNPKKTGESETISKAEKKEKELQELHKKIKEFEIKPENADEFNGLIAQFIDSYLENEDYPRLVVEEEGLDLYELYQQALTNWRDFRVSFNREKTSKKVSHVIELSSILKPLRKSKKITKNRNKDTSQLNPQLINDKWVSRVTALSTDHKNNEDRTQATLINHKDGPINYFAVYDGHGGSDCSEKLKEHLHTYVEKELQNISLSDPLATSNALKKAFIKANQAWKEAAEENMYLNGGSTATVTLWQGDVLYTANAGDSRAVLIVDDEIIQLSKDAKLEDPKCAGSVTKRGGVIKKNRVMGSIGMARCFGDLGIKGLTARPTISRYKVDNGAGKKIFLIIASDGVWDVLSTPDVLKAYKELKTKEVETLSDSMVNRALKLESQDDITVLVTSPRLD